MPALFQILSQAVLGAESSAPTAFDIVFPLAIVVLIGLAIPIGMLLANHFASRWALGRHISTPGKETAVESGLTKVIGGANERFSVKFYLIAMLFLAFDLEVAFLYPWAVRFADTPGWSPVLMLLPFLVMLEAGYLYLFKKGALDWEE